MRLLLLTFYYEPDLCAGSFRSGALVKSLLELISDDDTIEVVTTHPNRYATYKVETSGIEQHENLIIKRINIPSHQSGFFDQSLSFLKYFMDALFYVSNRKYDIVFATTSRLFTGFLGAIIARQKKIPLYLDIRDIFVDTLKSLFFKSKLKIFLPLLNLIEQFTLKSATKINLVSEGFLSYFSNKYKKQFTLFSNGIDDEFLNFKGPLKPIMKDDELVLTYTGNIGEGQGLEKIVPKIAKRFRNIEFVIIGDGGRKESLISACYELDNVKILPPVSREEIIKIYDKSDILFLHLNDYEAFKKVQPSKIFEYGATFKPIIAGVDGYSRAFIEKYLPDSMIFKPCDFEDFCRMYSSFEGVVNVQSRKDFIGKFSRKGIMQEMVKDILTLKI
jgi:glycosyltransferase involved in cell wall biosynthesis